MSSGPVRKIVRISALLLMVGSVIGFVATLLLGAFVYDKYDAYGEVRIPGSGKVHLPAGRTTISFHTVILSRAYDNGLPIPHLSFDIDPPPGVANPKVTENIGGSTSVNNNIHRRVWFADIPADGDYIITTSGEVNGYISPRLAFGRDSDSNDAWLGITAGLFVIGLATLITSSMWRSRVTRVESPAWQVGPPVPTPELDDPAAGADGSIVIHSGEGVKIEQLKTLAALRDSGALTEKEFQAEKRRVLKGD
ncbi:SHOCT domain-containing protein [Candidatus Mycobacterium wuenschmannii]|uniref:SHOCT domain-containing protein n=1 Tax=Candidatus Mycobacterium wuenschmannii TaxID=3027808 RepID=A0ABY8W4D8_9MYCO|nr:SHOCT domain-containing protein [Candidatus Mycobacterium wuenschmannii]WIM89288.1 SHOCT domain-containing protein [Candidatus Mycobacterium wuenschmannii]